MKLVFILFLVSIILCLSIVLFCVATIMTINYYRLKSVVPALRTIMYSLLGRGSFVDGRIEKQFLKQIGRIFEWHKMALLVFRLICFAMAMFFALAILMVKKGMICMLMGSVFCVIIGCVVLRRERRVICALNRIEQLKDGDA